MPSHSFESLQARLNHAVDTSDRGQTLPNTAAALVLEDPAERLVALVNALETERVLVPAVIESTNCEDGDVTTVDTDLGPAVVAFTSVDALTAWNSGARPVPMSGRKAAMLAVANSSGRLLIDEGVSPIRVPRPATVALAHGDSWLPAWEDAELQAELDELRSEQIAYVRPRPSAGAALRVEVGVLHTADRAKLAQELRGIAVSPRLRPAAEIVELVPKPMALA